MNDFDETLENGLMFRKPPREQKDDGEVKTKVRKEQYITDTHGSGSARQKVKYRQQRVNRNKKRQFRGNRGRRGLMGVGRSE